MPKMKPSEQLQKLKMDGFEVVQNETYSTISNELLSKTLMDWRANYQYEIDGVIVTDDAIYSRTSGNPDHAFAFKMVLSDQKAEVKVVDVIWTPSKDGFLKPRVRIEPVRLGGVTIEYATGYNAKFIEENKIGIGAIIEIIRSGDVIPKILSVSVPAEKAKMPTDNYKWNDTHVDVLLENASDNAMVQEKKLTVFFTSLEIDGLKAGNVKKLKDAGYDTIPKILKMTKEDFEKVGYKSLAQKYVDIIREKIDKATVIQLMAASGTMGRSLGEKKIEPILEAYPDILISSDSVQTKIAKVKSVKGVETKTATLFVENIPAFIGFLESIGQTKKLTVGPIPSPSKNDVDVKHPLYGKHIVMTKVRDQTITEALKKYGATLSNAVRSNTFVLIIKPLEATSNKKTDAEKYGVPIMTPEMFIAKYL
jgi:NAD-dependent DNA ligase